MRPGDDFVYKRYQGPIGELNPIERVEIVRVISSQRVEVRFDDGRQEVISRRRLSVAWRHRGELR